jgi:hypothetical protein
MLIASHLEKIKRLNDLRARLDPRDDFELWFWSTMVAGTNAVNAALHNARITPAESAFPSQPGVYYVQTGCSGDADEYKPVLKALGDVLHVGRPPIPGPIPSDIQTMMKAMEHIEHFRDPCTRGDMTIDTEIIAGCDKAYLQCLQLLDRRVSGKQP